MSLHGDEIRLLLLGANSSLTFKRISLTDPARPPFVALSYVWGDLNDTVPLNVSGETIAATRNLHHVLDCLFASGFDELLWIDALCIDQHNREERASQVAMMGDIYSHARYVLAFLSPQSEPFNLGLDYIEATARDTMIHFDPSISPHLTVQGFSASDKPLQDSIISFFRCSMVDQSLDGSGILKACRAWIDHENSCCWAARRPIDGSAHGFLDIPSEINGGLTIYTATLRVKHLMDMLIPGKLYTEDLLAAISLFRVRHCSDPRDRVFGYLELRSPGLDMKREISVDYNMPVADLYKSLAVKLIERSQTPDVLSHALHESCIRNRTDSLPSWVPDWDAAIDDRYHLTYTERTNTIRNFYASRNMKPEWRIQDPGHLITPGLQIAEIQETTPGYPSIIPGSTLGGKTIINQWLRLAGLSVYSDASPIDMPSCTKRERAFENALSGGFVSMKWSPGSLEYTKTYHAWLEWFVSSEVALAKSCKQVIQDFDELIRQTSERRRFIVTSDGQMGFGPERCEKGDVIMIIPGGKVPYVLRKTEDVKCTLRRYRLLGDAFINGVMEGEKISPSMSQFTNIVIV